MVIIITHLWKLYSCIADRENLREQAQQINDINFIDDKYEHKIKKEINKRLSTNNILVSMFSKKFRLNHNFATK